MEDYRAQVISIWRRQPDGREGICVDQGHAETLRGYDDFEVVDYLPAELLRGAVEALDTLWFELEAGTRDSARYAFRHLHADWIERLEQARAERDAGGR